VAVAVTTLATLVGRVVVVVVLEVLSLAAQALMAYHFTSKSALVVQAGGPARHKAI
jgi:hypothetical protein